MFIGGLKFILLFYLAQYKLRSLYQWHSCGERFCVRIEHNFVLHVIALNLMGELRCVCQTMNK